MKRGGGRGEKRELTDDAENPVLSKLPHFKMHNPPATCSIFHG